MCRARMSTACASLMAGNPSAYACTRSCASARSASTEAPPAGGGRGRSLRQAQPAPQRRARAPMPLVVGTDAGGERRGGGKARGERGEPRVELALEPVDLREHLARRRVVARVRARDEGDQGGREHAPSGPRGAGSPVEPHDRAGRVERVVRVHPRIAIVEVQGEPARHADLQPRPGVAAEGQAAFARGNPARVQLRRAAARRRGPRPRGREPAYRPGTPPPS